MFGIFNKASLSAALSAMLGLSLLTGCNTVEGAGQDVESAGDAIEDAADSNK